MQHHLLVGIDVQGYGGRDDVRQHDVQEQLAAMLQEAAKRARLRRSTWDIQQSGDGELAILPADAGSTAASALIDDYMRALAVALRRQNAERREECRLRLRAAIHYGVVARGRLGASGQGAVEVSRLLDCSELRELLAGPVDLVVILSQQVYRSVVLQSHTSLAADDFVEIQVHNKEFRQRAYVSAPLFKPPWVRGAREDTGRLNRAQVAELLSQLYPENPPAEDASTDEFLAQLRELGYSTIGALRETLNETYLQGEQYAERNPPLGPPGALHTGLGIARLTLALADRRFAELVYGGPLEPL